MFGVGVGAVHVVPIGGAGGEFRVAERLDGVSHETGFGYARLGGGLGKQIEQLLVHEDPEGVAVSSHGFIVSLVVAVPGRGMVRRARMVGVLVSGSKSNAVPRSLSMRMAASNFFPDLDVKPFRVTDCPARSLRAVWSVMVLPAMRANIFHPQPAVVAHLPSSVFSVLFVEHCHIRPVF